MIHELPMIAEREATERVRAIYVDIRRAFPYVPMLFRALAIQPVGLMLAWEHARAVLRSPHMAAAALSLERAATPDRPLVDVPWRTLSVSRQAALRAILGHFAQTMPLHGLMAASLVLSLGGAISGDPLSLSDWHAERHEPVQPEIDLIEPDEAPPALRERFAQIRALVGLPYVEALWRALASDPVLLDAVWSAMSRHLDRDGFQAHEASLLAGVRDLAVTVTPDRILSAMAMTRAGIDETLPAVARLVSLMASGALRHAAISMTLSAAIESQIARAA